jgi:hypothetical protein
VAVPVRLNVLAPQAGQTATVTQPPLPVPPARKPIAGYRGVPEGDCTWTGTLAPGEVLRLDATGENVLSGPSAGSGVPGGKPIPFYELRSLEIASSTPGVTVDPQQNQVVIRNSGGAPVNKVTIHWKVRQ